MRQIGIESSGSYGAGLTRHLQAVAVSVLEVNRLYAHTRNRREDAIDAEAAARKVLAGECTAIPKDTTGIVEAIRQLLLAGPAPCTGSASSPSRPRPRCERR